MKNSYLISLGLFALGLILFKKCLRKEKKYRSFNGIVFKPTAIFICQGSLKPSKLKFKYHND